MKSRNIDLQKKIGVLGGGQLGRMLQEVALRYGVDLYFLENDQNAPCSIFKDNFTHGSFRDLKSVINFAKDKNVVTIEIEHINTDALDQLAKYDIDFIPKVDTIKLIKNKASQKQFYLDHKIPSAPFIILSSSKISETIAQEWYPFVQKTQTDGYDGKGVVIIRNDAELIHQLGEPSILEKKIEFEKELAITYAMERNGTIHLYPICEMVFDPKLNLVDYLIAPANISEKTTSKIDTITRKLAKAINSPGIFSIEFFLTKDGDVLVNEIAPRAHNSAHYTIEACNISQYEAQLKILLDIPIGEIKMNGYAGMVNLIGEEGFKGFPKVVNIEKLNEIENCFIHLYGKKETKPGRKMGHITLLNKNKKQLIEDLKWLRTNIKVVS